MRHWFSAQASPVADHHRQQGRSACRLGSGGTRTRNGGAVVIGVSVVDRTESTKRQGRFRVRWVRWSRPRAGARHPPPPRMSARAKRGGHPRRTAGDAQWGERGIRRRRRAGGDGRTSRGNRPSRQRGGPPGDLLAILHRKMRSRQRTVTVAGHGDWAARVDAPDHFS